MSHKFTITHALGSETIYCLMQTYLYTIHMKDERATKKGFVEHVRTQLEQFGSDPNSLFGESGTENYPDLSEKELDQLTKWGF